MSNQITVVGNLTREPELRYTPTGAAVVKFGLAVNRFYTNRNGEKVECIGQLRPDALAASANAKREDHVRDDEAHAAEQWREENAGNDRGGASEGDSADDAGDCEPGLHGEELRGKGDLGRANRRERRRTYGKTSLAAGSGTLQRSQL